MGTSLHAARKGPSVPSSKTLSFLRGQAPKQVSYALFVTILLVAAFSVLLVSLTFLQQHFSAAGRGPRAKRPYDSTREFPHFTVVTYAVEHNFAELENLIGSLHAFSPGVPLAIYDLGLSKPQTEQLWCMRDVIVIPFDFQKYPPHVEDIRNFAFRPILSRDALNHFQKVLVLDPGFELRNSLDNTFDIIETVGYFFVQQGEGGSDKLAANIAAGTVRELSLNINRYANHFMCLASVQGYRRDTFTVTKVLDPTVECALNPDCIAPVGDDDGVHSYDQAVLSAFIRKHGFYCYGDNRYRETSMLNLTPFPRDAGQPQTLFWRESRSPKPYSEDVSHSNRCHRSDAKASSLIHMTEVGSGTHSTSQRSRILQKRQQLRSSFDQSISTVRDMATYAASVLVYAWRFTPMLRTGLLMWFIPMLSYLLVPAKFKALRRTLTAALFFTGVSAVLYQHEIFQSPWSLQCSSDSEGRWAIGVAQVSAVYTGEPPAPRSPAPGAGAAAGAQISMTDAPLQRLHWLGRVRTAAMRANSTISCADSRDMVSTFVSTPFVIRAVPPETLPGSTDEDGKVSKDRHWYMFFEGKDAGTRSLVWNGLAAVAYAKSVDDGATWRYGGVVLRESVRLSYPFVFWHEGQPFMIPETARSYSVRLYTTRHFPESWYVSRVLLTGRRFTSCSPLNFDEHWYMWCGDADDPDHGNLYLFHSKQLIGPWTEHPSSPVVRADKRYARPAGRPIVDNEGRVVRFAQDRTLRFGQSVHAIEVLTLTTSSYAERPLHPESVPFLYGEMGSSRWNAHRMHHVDIQPVNSSTFMVVVDGD